MSESFVIRFDVATNPRPVYWAGLVDRLIRGCLTETCALSEYLKDAVRFRAAADAEKTVREYWEAQFALVSVAEPANDNPCVNCGKIHTGSECIVIAAACFRRTRTVQP